MLIACIMFKWKFKKELINLSFIKAILTADERPQCVLCGNVFSNETLKWTKWTGLSKLSTFSIRAHQENFSLQRREFKRRLVSSGFMRLNITISKSDYCHDVLLQWNKFISYKSQKLNGWSCSLSAGYECICDVVAIHDAFFCKFGSQEDTKFLFGKFGNPCCISVRSP